MKYVLIILFLQMIFIISVTFGAQNDQVVTFNYLLAQNQFQVSILLTSSFAAGFLIGWVICDLFWLRARVALMWGERKVEHLKQQFSRIPAGCA